MPIRPENLALYPDDWPQISHRIRFGRAQGHCECAGDCGRPTHTGPCPNRHGHPDYANGKPIVLTTAHLNHQPEDVRDENLAALCAPCHLAYDAEVHRETRRANRDAALLSAGQLPLFDTHPDPYGRTP